MSWKKSYLELKEEMETLQGQYYKSLKLLGEKDKKVREAIETAKRLLKAIPDDGLVSKDRHSGYLDGGLQILSLIERELHL